MNSVSNSVQDFVRKSVINSVWNSVVDSITYSIGDCAWDYSERNSMSNSAWLIRNVIKDSVTVWGSVYQKLLKYELSK